MTIRKILLHVRDIERSVHFYSRYLQAVPIGSVSVDHAELDGASAVIELIRLKDGVDSTRQEDDLFRGFRHIGFKVADIAPIVDLLGADGVPILLGPGFAPIGRVNLAFFEDPDGTRLEIVDGHLDYGEIYDPDEEAAERAASRPERPRFDHIAQTCSDLHRRESELVAQGFRRVGRLQHPEARGFTLDYFRAGQGVLEVFTFSEPTAPGEPRLDSYGFVAVQVNDSIPSRHGTRRSPRRWTRGGRRPGRPHLRRELRRSDVAAEEVLRNPSGHSEFVLPSFRGGGIRRRWSAPKGTSMTFTKRRRTLALTAAALTAVALTGCTGDGSASGSSEPSGTSEPSGNAMADTLTLGAILQPHTFQASEANFSQESVFLSAVYDTLLQVDESGDLAPALVTDWSWDDTKTVVTLQLRTDVAFTDGSPFNADVAVANLTRFRDGTSTNASQLADMVSAEADGDSTVVLTLAAPNPAFLTYLTQNAGLQESAEAFDNPDIQTNPVGSGPFILNTDATVEGNSYVYDRNPDYWNPDQQHYEQLIVRVFGNSTAVLNAIKAGEVDGTPLFTTADNAIAEAAGYTLSAQQPGWNGLTLADRDGTMNPALGDVRVRQAINYAFDRQALLDAVAGGQGEVTQQMFPPSSAAYDESLDSYYDYVPDKARELLAEAGYPDGFTLAMPTARGALGAPVYDLIADQLGDVGITVEETEVPVGEFFTALLTPEFPAYYMQLQKDPADWQLAQFILTPNATWNPFHTTDPTVAGYLESIQLGDQAEAESAARDLNRYLVENVWFAPFYSPGYRYASSPNVEVLTMEGGGGAMPALWNIVPCRHLMGTASHAGGAMGGLPVAPPLTTMTIRRRSNRECRSRPQHADRRGLLPG